MYTRSDMKKELEKEKYEEVRNSDEFKRVMLLTVGGSHAYGTNLENETHVSDVDFRGVVAPGLEEVYAMEMRDKPYLWNNNDTDVTLYPLKQMIKLLCGCNPNIVEALGTRDEQVLYCTEAGKLLRDNLGLFLTQRAGHTFGGMARNNLRLMKNILAKDKLTAKDKAGFTVDSLELVMNHAVGRLETLTGQKFEFSVDDKVNSENLLDYIVVNAEIKNMKWLEFKSLIGEVNNTISGYDKQKLTQRNAKKDEVHLYKHIMHTIRTFRMGVEILRGEGVKVYREEDREELLAIREKKFTIDELFEMAEKEEKNLEDAKKHTSLPVEVDREKVNELTMELTKMCLYGR